MRRLLLATAALTLAAFTGGAQAAPVLGSHVDSSVFASAIGSTSGWNYMGQSVGAFSGNGTAELKWRSSSYADSFGYANTAHGGRVSIFGTGASVGATSLVSGYSPDYLFYFQGDGSDFLVFSDDNRQYTDGHDTGGNPGENQADIDIFHNAAQSIWAFFYDDAGGGVFIAGDDNDYDDMVVTFAEEAAQSVPEPAGLALLGLALLAVPALRRRIAAK